MGALMDISARRAEMDGMAKEKGQAHWGEGWDRGWTTDSSKLLMSTMAIGVDSTCWATRLDAALAIALFTTDDRRRDALVSLAAITTALIEDIDRKKESK